MSWVEALPALCGLGYLAAAVGYLRLGQPAWALTYAAYAVANIGLIWAAIRGRA